MVVAFKAERQELSRTRTTLWLPSQIGDEAPSSARDNSEVTRAGNVGRIILPGGRHGC